MAVQAAVTLVRQALDYPPTSYAATCSSNTRWPPLDSSASFSSEVCVIGGGLAGVATALELARRGRSVVLLEAHRIGWGASGRNGGFAVPGYPVEMSDLLAQLGRDEALALWRLSLGALNKLRLRVERSGSSILVSRGSLCCRMVEHPDTLPTYVTMMNDVFDAGLVHVPTEKVREMLVTSRYSDGYHDPKALLVHPLNLVRGMAGDATRLGARLHEGSRVLAVHSDGAEKVVATATGSVRARHIVFAGGAYMGMLHHALGFATVPIATFVITTRPALDPVRAAINTGMGVSDTRVATDYYRALPDGRLLWGGRASAWHPNSARIAQLLHRDMTRIYPQLSNVPVEKAWGGWMAYARHRMPIIGPVADGVWVAGCFGGLGVVTTTLAGDLIAAAIDTGDDRYRRFAKFGLPFAAGRLGGAAFQMQYWYHQLCDRLTALRAQ